MTAIVKMIGFRDDASDYDEVVIIVKGDNFDSKDDGSSHNDW